MDNTTAEAASSRPFTVDPSSGVHTHTLILLHGLGSNGHRFGTELLETGVTSSGRRLTSLLPGARFVFPTSRRRRSTAFRRAMLTQWFDITRLDDPSHRRDRQLGGLEESAHELLDIVTAELKLVVPEKLVIGGLSQGCAMSLALIMCLDQPIGGYIGMSGFLAYASDLESAVAEDQDDDDDDDDNPFSTSDDDATRDAQHPTIQVQSFTRDLLALDPLVSPNPSKETTAWGTPIFLGHGSADEKVPCSLGRDAARVMAAAGYQVTWRCYEGQGHWYKVPDEMDDICAFIDSQVGWEMSQD